MIKAITKKPIIATIAATILLGTVLIASNTFANNVVAQPPTPSSPCPPDGEVQHWDKIVFEIEEDDSETIPEELLEKQMDLKILDTPEQIVDLEQEVANAVGIQFGVDPADLEIKIIDVLYQTITCGFTGPKGDAGPKGDTGPAGATGATGGFLTTYANNGPSTNVPQTSSATSTANCDAGDIATGGGSAIGSIAKLVSSLPTFTAGTPTGWAVQAFNPTTQASVFIAATVVCADVTP